MASFIPDPNHTAKMLGTFDRAAASLVADHRNLWPTTYPTKEIEVDVPALVQINTPRIDPETQQQAVNEHGQLLFDSGTQMGTVKEKRRVPDLEAIQAIFAEMDYHGAAITLVHTLFSGAVNASTLIALGQVSPQLMAFVQAAVNFRDSITPEQWAEENMMDNRPPVQLIPDFNTGVVTVSPLPEP